MCAWLDAWNLAAAWSSTSSGPCGGSERGFIGCLCDSLFVFGQLGVAGAHLHGACSFRTIIGDGGNGRLRGGGGRVICARSPMDTRSGSRRAWRKPVARAPAIALAAENRSGDRDRGYANNFDRSGSFDLQSKQIREFLV